MSDITLGPYANLLEERDPPVQLASVRNGTHYTREGMMVVRLETHKFPAEQRMLPAIMITTCPKASDSCSQTLIRDQQFIAGRLPLTSNQMRVRAFAGVVWGYVEMMSYQVLVLLNESRPRR
jgi:hypothetical protein